MLKINESERDARELRTALDAAQAKTLREENANLRDEILKSASAHQLQLMEVVREKTRLANLVGELESRLAAMRAERLSRDGVEKTPTEGAVSGGPSDANSPSNIMLPRLECLTEHISHVENNLRRLAGEVARGEARVEEATRACERARNECTTARERIVTLTAKFVESEAARHEAEREAGESNLTVEALSEQIKALSSDLNTSVARQRNTQTQLIKLKSEFSLLALRYDSLTAESREGCAKEELPVLTDNDYMIENGVVEGETMQPESPSRAEEKRARLALMDGCVAVEGDGDEVGVGVRE